MSKVNGTRRLSERLRKIPQEVVRDVVPALIRSGDDMAEAASLLAPIDTGDLEQSIHVTVPEDTTPSHSSGGERTAGPNQVLVTAGNEDVRYSHLQEFGPEHHDAQPFFFPAFRLTREKSKRRINRAINKAIKDNAKGK